MKRIRNVDERRSNGGFGFESGVLGIKRDSNSRDLKSSSQWGLGGVPSRPISTSPSALDPNEVLSNNMRWILWETLAWRARKVRMQRSVVAQR